VIRTLLLALVLVLPFPSPSRASTVRAVVRLSDQIRAVQMKVVDGEVHIPLFACGPILGGEARWDRLANRWEMRGRQVLARGFLDEPLVFVGGQPLLVRNPPRLIDEAPYLSLEVLRVLGRHGWETDVVWDEAARELVVKAAQQESAAPIRTRRIGIPSVPSGARLVVLDAGHPRGAGARGARGSCEGDMGLALAQAISATMAFIEGSAPVIIQGEEGGLEPAEAAGLANALEASAYVGFHANRHGAPGIVLWVFGLSNIAGTGVAFEPFEPGQGWARTASAHSARSVALARRMLKSLADAGLPVAGPIQAPLIQLEGLECPAVIVEFEGLGTAPGASLALDEEPRGRFASAMASALAPETRGSQ
jgi:N-acetylmuramoyl-L-alanine amidase